MWGVIKSVRGGVNHVLGSVDVFLTSRSEGGAGGRAISGVEEEGGWNKGEKRGRGGEIRERELTVPRAGFIRICAKRNTRGGGLGLAE
jgi:hypothetical protein